MLKVNWKLVGHILFNLGFWMFWWGAFEMAYQSPNHPIWSGTFGYPIFHHYIFGAILTYISYLFLAVHAGDFIFKTEKELRRRLERIFIRKKKK